MPRGGHLTPFFFECQALKRFWNDVEYRLLEITGISIKLNTTSALFGLTNELNVTHRKLKEANLLIILGKHCISKRKYSKQSPSLSLIFEQELLLRKKDFQILSFY